MLNMNIRVARNRIKLTIRITNKIPNSYSYQLHTTRAFSSRKEMDLFTSSEHAKLYAAYRPTYPQSVFDAIIDFCKVSRRNTFTTALDIGCGSGQSSYPLAAHFKDVIGLDVSESQVKQAKEKYPKLKFHVGVGEDLSFADDASVDLVTVAQAFHWLDHSKFYAEVTRVLRPGGALVVYGYGLSEVDNVELQTHITKFYKKVLNGYWETGRQHVENKYSDFSLPFPNWTRNDTMKIVKDWSPDKVIGYYESSSAWRDYSKKSPRDPALANLRKLLLRCYPDSKGDAAITIRWPVFMLMGRKP